MERKKKAEKKEEKKETKKKKKQVGTIDATDGGDMERENSREREGERRRGERTE